MDNYSLSLRLHESNRINQAKAEAGLISLMEGLKDQLDPAMKDWLPTGKGLGQKEGEFAADFANIDFEQLRKKSRKLYYTNAHGRVCIRNLVKFIIGQGSIVDFHEKDDKNLTDLISVWNTFSIQNKWKLKQREIVTRFFRDGETFIRRFSTKNGIQIRFIDPELIPQMDGIQTDPKDAETAVKYNVQTSGGNSETIDAKDILHLKCDVDANVKRGLPILWAAMPYIQKYDNWLDARMVLNIIRTSVALVRKVQGSPTDILRLRSNQQSQKNTTKENDKTKMLRPGTILTGSPGIDYQMLSPNLDARDAAMDGRTIELKIASVAGFPDIFVTSDYQNSNFASTVVAQNPAVREFEDWQMVFSEGFSVIVEWVLQDAIEKGEISSSMDLTYDIAFPPLLRRDLGQETSAYEKMFDKKAISRRTWMLKAGLDPDKEMKLMEEETKLPDNLQPPDKTTKSNPTPKRVEDRSPRQNVEV